MRGAGGTFLVSEPGIIRKCLVGCRGGGGREAPEMSHWSRQALSEENAGKICVCFRLSTYLLNIMNFIQHFKGTLQYSDKSRLLL